MSPPPLFSSGPSAARQWPPLAKLIAREQQLAKRAAAHGKTAIFLYEFLRFGIKQGWACLFGGLMLALIIATKLWYSPHATLARYDFLVLGALAIQAGMLFFRLETLEELKIILIFHVVGTLMELFKTHTGSWIYPEASHLRIGGVPLFSGFMYGAIGSYIARVWRLFHFQFMRHPPGWALALLSVAIYANFFADHYGVDLRLALLATAALLFARTIIYFRVWRTHRHMPLLLGLVLVALFIWLAENIGTFMGAWLYPTQAKHWTAVPISKLASWFLLMIISYTLTALAQTRQPASITPSLTASS